LAGSWKAWDTGAAPQDTGACFSVDWGVEDMGMGALIGVTSGWGLLTYDSGQGDLLTRPSLMSTRARQFERLMKNI
jgi:hypothetical protein